VDGQTEERERIGRRIRLARQAAGLSQDELGSLVKVDKRTVGNWENGRTDPRNRLGALEHVLGPLTDGSPARDQIVAAVESSDLTRSEQHELLGHYYRIRERRDREPGRIDAG